MLNWVYLWDIQAVEPIPLEVNAITKFTESLTALLPISIRVSCNHEFIQVRTSYPQENNEKCK